MTPELTDRLTSVTPSAQQAHAIRSIENWFRHETQKQPIFRVFGFAGVGKTTITRLAIAELGLSVAEPQNGALFAAFTGKAALVMTRHGTPASTIHQLLYRVSEVTPAEIERLKTKIQRIKTELSSISPTARRIEEGCLARLEMQLTDAYRPRFTLNEESIVRDAALIVLDEVSMVGEDLALDLLKFQKPILVLGDPGQLPPIHGEGYFTDVESDVMLTEIHRQAADSPIIRLATNAREGRPIPHGVYGDGVRKASHHNASVEELLEADQVICGRNATRMQLNLAMRHAYGLTEDLPVSEQDKIIVLRNRHDLGLVNGQFVTVDDVAHVDDITISATVRTDDGKQLCTLSRPTRLDIYTGHFLDHFNLDPERGRRDHWKKKGLVEATWGNCITCHKAQGSQWPAVTVIDDGLGRTSEDRSRWLYTAITRAEKELTIYA
jgi:exodeoxyribonuclease-5